MTTETKEPKAKAVKEKKQPKEKKEKAVKPWSPAAQSAATQIVTLWGSIVSVQSIRGTAKDGKLAESLDRSTVYLKRSAKLLSEAVE
jgi:hypothetical protein